MEGLQQKVVIGKWLMCLCVMVFMMIIVGGLTRLTQSGLSMVDWRPLMGIFPPVGQAAWEEVFAAYKQYPEYQKINVGMTLDDFKQIFWFEYGHRILGRLIGLVFALPFLYFLIKRMIPRHLYLRLGILFLLGGLQGVIGWWMVKSGLVNRPDVSHYRLTTHLGMAFMLHILLLWTALSQLRSVEEHSGHQKMKPLGKYVLLLCGSVYVTVLSGGLMAGLNAGAQFNTFPLMAGQVIPDGLFIQQPWYRNMTENLMTLQFNHRYLALSTALGVLVLWQVARKRSLTKTARLALNLSAGMVVLQVSLGIATLLSIVWLPLASLHQTGATILLSLLVWLAHELCYPGTWAFKQSSSAQAIEA